MQTTMTFDWGVIATAVMPTAAIVVTAVIGWWSLRRTRREDQRERARIAKLEADNVAEIKKQTFATHVLVNDQLTREKSARLLDAKSNRIALAKLIGDKPTAEEAAHLASLERQIEGLAAEITQRDFAAGTLLDPEPDERSGPEP